MTREGAGTVRLLELDPDLGARIDPQLRPAAVSRAVAGVLAVDRGPWRSRRRDNMGLGAVEPVDVILSNATFHWILDHDALFSAILQGMILVRVEFAGIRARLELLGEGDMISPWHGMGPQPTAPCLITAHVSSQTSRLPCSTAASPCAPPAGRKSTAQ